MKTILRAFYFKPEDLKQLKIGCAENDVKMSHVMRFLLEELLEDPTRFKRICERLNN